MTVNYFYVMLLLSYVIITGMSVLCCVIAIGRHQGYNFALSTLLRRTNEYGANFKFLEKDLF